MADTMSSLELDCGICGTNLQLMDISAVQLEFTMDLWKRDHSHSTRERNTWYRAEVRSALGDDQED